MSLAQPNLFGDDRSDLFGAPKPAAYRVNPQHVINRFIEFEAQMKAATDWPWDEDEVATLRGRTWPYLLNKLIEVDCAAEAAKWKAIMEAEAARLDAIGPPPAWQAAPTPCGKSATV
jgi:hypothetical protein